MSHRFTFYEFYILFQDFCKTRTCFVFRSQKESRLKDEVDWGEKREV